MDLNPKLLEAALARRPKYSEPKEYDSVAPGNPDPSSLPGSKDLAAMAMMQGLGVEGDPNLVIEPIDPNSPDAKPMAQRDLAGSPDMVIEPIEIPDMLGVDRLSDSDKQMLMEGKPKSLTGKVRQSVLRSKAESKDKKKED